MKDASFQALIGDRTVNLSFEDGELTIDERSVAFSFESCSEKHFSLLIDGRSVPVVVTPAGSPKTYNVTAAGHTWEIRVKDERDLLLERFGLDEGLMGGEITVRAPMPGLVLDVLVEPGDTVEADAGLLVLEAMKMENELKAPADGQVKAVHVSPGDAVGKNEVLIEFEA